MPPWHALLAPLPDDANPTRTPVAPPEILATPDGAAIAGWEQLSLHLSAGTEGLRHVMVILNAAGQPIAASDHVLHRTVEDDGGAAIVRHRHTSIGGRLEPDGTFKGTCWTGSTVEPADGEPVNDSGEPVIQVSRPSQATEPTPEQVATLRRLVADVMRRAPPS